MKLFSLVGWSGSGKTTLAARLISHYKRNNFTVAVIKKIAHNYSFQPKGKDSFTFLQAGADHVCLASESEIVVIKPRAEDRDIRQLIESDLNMFDFVLLEGFTLNQVPVAEVYDSEKHKSMKFPLKKLSLIISDMRSQEKIPWFHRDNIDGIAEYIKENAYE
jgi:molybdopterin-guanine dinucleotide biosynthesis protein B